MPTHQPLDLAELDPPIWHVEVSGETYGPYTLGQMQSFIDEGRVTGASRIAKEDTALFRNAWDIPAFALMLPEQPTNELLEETSRQTGTGSNFVIIARGPDGDLTETRRTLSHTLNTFGRFAESLPGVFVLRSANRLADIRANLEHACLPGTQVMIIESLQGRLGWLGMADDIDAHIRSVWNAKLD